LADRKPIPPKSIVDAHTGQKYTCTFDPNASKDRQWVWRVDYTRVYTFYGACPTAEAATKQARRKIHNLNMHMDREDENE